MNLHQFNELKKEIRFGSKKKVIEVVKSSLPSNHKRTLENLVPDARDEILWPNVGPSLGALARNRQDILKGIKKPILVQKLIKGGFLIVDGHHRWMVYWELLEQGIVFKKIPLKILNKTDLPEIYL